MGLIYHLIFLLMSEYQYYDFYSIDRPLTRDEREAIDDLSSRSHSSARRITFEYNYSDFRHDEEEVLSRYFDMMLYVTNWGTRRLLIKLPAEVVPYNSLKPYEAMEMEDYLHCEVKKRGEHILIDLVQNEEGGGGWMEGEGLLDEMLELRAQLLAGDYRLLYIAWLYCQAYSEEASAETVEPPLPPNLKRLDASLKSFMNFWEIPRDLISAASVASETIDTSAQQNLSSHIGQLSEAEKDEFLRRLLEDDPQAKLKLMKRLREFAGSKGTTNPGSRTLADLQEATARQSEIRLEKERQQAAKALEKKMKRIGYYQAQMWKDADKSAALKSARGYKEAAREISELKAYAKYSGEMTQFEEKLEAFMQRYGNSLALRRRLKEKGV